MSNVPRTLLVGFAAGATWMYLGCQLVATVDRGLIPEGPGATSSSGAGGGGGIGSSVASSGASGGAGGAGGGAECSEADAEVTCGKTTACAQRACVAGACVTDFAKAGSVCAENGGTICDGKGKCVASSCSDGILDGDETDLDCGGSCVPCPNDAKCKVALDCSSGYCDGSSCQPCTMSTQCTTDRYCDLASKNCVADRDQGAACGEPAECNADACVDGVCCDTACTGPCAACSKAKGAPVDGTCAASVVKDAPDAGTCDDLAGGCGGKCRCDATGACKRTVGTPCSAAGECASGFCVDGVCCDTACTGPCAACSTAKGAPADGACAASAVKGTSDAGACDDLSGGCGAACSCSALGMCLRKNGAPCAAAAECASSVCSAMVCAAN